MNFIKRTIMGIAIGAGAILPGISSGVLCLIFGIYEKLLDSILNFFKDIKNNFKFLLPIGIGGILGVVLFSKVLNFFFVNYINSSAHTVYYIQNSRTSRVNADIFDDKIRTFYNEPSHDKECCRRNISNDINISGD